MFSVAYIKQIREHGTNKNKFLTQSLKCIVVGKCPLSDGLLFYHPPTKQLLSCADGYKFDPYFPAGPQFSQHFDANFHLTFHSDMEASAHQPPTHEQESTMYTKIDNKYEAVHILSIPIDPDTPYVVQVCNSGDIMEVTESDLVDHDPDVDATSHISNPFELISWLKPGAKATLYLADRMNTPKQGFLEKDGTTNVWFFIPGRKKSNPPMPLPNFHETAHSMILNKKLFCGWVSRNTVLHARHSRATSNVLANLIRCKKVSAKDLHDMQAPGSLLRHHNLHPEDKITWDLAYEEEYNGLASIDTWETITEEEYQNLKHTYKGTMPTMAISTIKYDENGQPVRAKYRIVALGNLDPNNWDKQDCFAPVLSHLELCFLVSLAAQKKCIPKSGDVSQAFVQSILPDDEKYVLRPPPGCPITKPNCYWLLKRTLYGLKRSPRHWYALATQRLLDIGFKQHPTSPCIFVGQILQDHPPVYLGLYVDDFIYFSESPEAEKEFEKKFRETSKMDFNGPVQFFLGIKFKCVKHTNGHVSIHMGQEAFTDNLVTTAGLEDPSVVCPSTPYRSGYPVDSIPSHLPNSPLDPIEQAKLVNLMQTYVGCLTWLSTCTRPDIATITNILAKYTHTPTKAHIDHVKYVIKYLKATKTLGICFSSDSRISNIESHVKFPIPKNTVTPLCDANWGPQDASIPKKGKVVELDLFKSRSISGFLIWFNGPLHWVSKRQTITARSSAEAEIYATDECTKALIQLFHLVDGLGLTESMMKPPITIYNDNNACVCWSKNTSTKGLRHIQIRENAVRESVQKGFINVKHISGKLNLGDMFTKEEKDTTHFLTCRDTTMMDSDSIRLDSHFSSTFDGQEQGGC
jgi:hypothetical protein